MKAKVKLNNYIDNSITISGSKNSSLPIIAACLLCDEDVTINNVPNINDVNILIKIMKKMGCNISFDNNVIKYKKSYINKKIFNYKDIKKLRGSYYLIGSLIGISNYCNFTFSIPGGCKLGYRPINYHIDAFKKMGLNVSLSDNKIKINGYKKHAMFTLAYPSVGATINIILSSCKLEKETIITNASIEPEVIDLCDFLRSMGVIININKRTIYIQGKSFLNQTIYTIIDDRIEAGTFLVLGAIHHGITIKNVNKTNLEPLINLLTDIGYNIIIKDNNCNNLSNISIDNCFNNKIKPFNITLNPHPNIPTDLGPILCVLAATINGTSHISDNVYSDRISHVKQLQKFNIDIKHKNNVIIINGGNNITNANVKAYDLRCAAALVLAASLNNKYSNIYNIDNLFRGYENIKDKLAYLGINFI